MKQATMHTAMHLPRSYHPYIFPTTPITIHTSPILPSSSMQAAIHSHQPRQFASIQQPTLHPYPQSLHHKTQHPAHTTMHPNLHRNTILPSKRTSLHKTHIHRHRPSRAIPHNTTLPPTRTTNTTQINHYTTHSTKLKTQDYTLYTYTSHDCGGCGGERCRDGSYVVNALLCALLLVSLLFGEEFLWKCIPT